jgi:hypothetical protein
MASSLPNENPQSAPSPDIYALSGGTLTGAGVIGFAVATVLTHGLAVPIVVGISAVATATGVTIPWIPVLRKPKRRREGKK